MSIITPPTVWLTRHSQERLSERGISLSEVQAAMAHYDMCRRSWSDDGRPAIEYHAGDLVVVTGVRDAAGEVALVTAYRRCAVA